MRPQIDKMVIILYSANLSTDLMNPKTHLLYFQRSVVFRFQSIVAAAKKSRSRGPAHSCSGTPLQCSSTPPGRFRPATVGLPAKRLPAPLRPLWNGVGELLVRLAPCVRRALFPVSPFQSIYTQGSSFRTCRGPLPLVHSQSPFFPCWKGVGDCGGGPHGRAASLVFCFFPRRRLTPTFPGRGNGRGHPQLKWRRCNLPLTVRSASVFVGMGGVSAREEERSGAGGWRMSVRCGLAGPSRKVGARHPVWWGRTLENGGSVPCGAVGAGSSEWWGLALRAGRSTPCRGAHGWRRQTEGIRDAGKALLSGAPHSQPPSLRTKVFLPPPSTALTGPFFSFPALPVDRKLLLLNVRASVQVFCLHV